MIRPGRKKYLSRFSAADNALTLMLLAAVFIIGMALSSFAGISAALLYLFLWAASYGVIYAGTCRYCAYYGKRCPIPLEGSCVHRFFAKKETGFGWMQLLWATLAYGLRVAVPVSVILSKSLAAWGALYFSVLIGFWAVHLRISGCPNCINTKCPLNPDYSP